jgi:uncharacterized membrane protein YeaQ/YmgE (transglycosylase-associated protein family)
MEMLSWLVIGVVTGSLARAVMPGPPGGGMRVAILIGLIGAFVGGFLGVIFPMDQLLSFNFYACGLALIGSLYLLFAYRCIAMRSSRLDNKWRA